MPRPPALAACLAACITGLVLLAVAIVDRGVLRASVAAVGDAVARGAGG